MLRFFLWRVLSTLPVVLVVSFLVFGLVLLIPGDPAITIAGPDATPAQIETIRARLGLDRPFLVQYADWLGSALQADLGTSLFTSRAVTTSIRDSLPVTLALTLTAIVISLLVSVPLAVLSATRRGGRLDRLATVVLLGGHRPAVLLARADAGADVQPGLGWLPATGYVPSERGPRRLADGTSCCRRLTLGVAAAAESTRQLRGSIIEVLQQDYVRTARAKGLRSPHGRRQARVQERERPAGHRARPAGHRCCSAAPSSWSRSSACPGLGQVAISAVTTRDVPVIQGVVLVAVLVAMLSNLLVDLTYGYLNPKVRAR